jgi:hypothetical protein
MASEATLLIAQFLAWVAERPRRYADLRQAWSSTCPLNCAWEDAVSDNLVEHRSDGMLALTVRGETKLRSSAGSGVRLIADSGGVS